MVKANDRMKTYTCYCVENECRKKNKKKCDKQEEQNKNYCKYLATLLYLKNWPPMVKFNKRNLIILHEPIQILRSHRIINYQSYDSEMKEKVRKNTGGGRWLSYLAYTWLPSSSIASRSGHSSLVFLLFLNVSPTL